MEARRTGAFIPEGLSPHQAWGSWGKRQGTEWDCAIMFIRRSDFVCALDRLQNKYLRLENRKSTIHTKCSLQEVAVSNSRQGPNWGQPLFPLNKG